MPPEERGVHQRPIVLVAHAAARVRDVEAPQLLEEVLDGREPRGVRPPGMVRVLQPIHLPGEVECER